MKMERSAIVEGNMIRGERYIQCEINRPKALNFLGIPVQCGQPVANRVEETTADTGDSGDSFKIKINIDGATEIQTKAPRRILKDNVTGISFSRSDATKAFSWNASSMVVIKSTKDTREALDEGAEASLGNTNPQKCITNERLRQIKQEKSDTNLKRLSTAVSPVLKTKVTTPQKGPTLKKKETKVSENVKSGCSKDTAGAHDIHSMSDGCENKSKNTGQTDDDRDDIDKDFGLNASEKSLSEERLKSKRLKLEKDIEKCDKEAFNPTVDEPPKSISERQHSASRKHRNAFSSIEAKLVDENPENSDKRNEEQEHMLRITEVRSLHTPEKNNPSKNRRVEPTVEHSAIVEQETADTDSQVLEITQPDTQMSALKQDVAEKKNDQTPNKTATECLPPKKRKRPENVERPNSLADQTAKKQVSPKEAKAKYRIISPREERKVDFCDECNMSVQDMLMHNANYHWL